MTGPSSRAPVLLLLVWLGGLLVATCVGLLAVRLVAAQVGDPAVAPLSAAAAASAAAGSTPSSGPSPTGPTQGPALPRTTSGWVPVRSTPRPDVAATSPRTFTSPGGTLGVVCAGRALRLLYARPGPGFGLDERSIAGSEGEVRFEGGGTEVRLRLSCATGVPQLVERRTDRDGAAEEDDRRDEDDRRQDEDPRQGDDPRQDDAGDDD